MNEKQLEKQIKAYFKANGGYVTKGNSSLNRGVPDLLVCFKGLFIAIEVKSKGFKPRKNQVIHINSIIKSGGIAFYCDSFEDFENKLNSYL